MTFLDAYALIAFLADESAAAQVQEILEEGDAAVPSVNLAEAMDVCVRSRTLLPREVRAVVAGLVAARLRVVACEEEHGLKAGELRATHYDPSRCAVSIPDCILVASARPGDRIATADSGVSAVARAEGIDIAPLPDTRGQLPR